MCFMIQYIINVLAAKGCIACSVLFTSIMLFVHCVVQTAKNVSLFFMCLSYHIECAKNLRFWLYLFLLLVLSFCFVCFNAIFLRPYKFRIFITYSQIDPFIIKKCYPLSLVMPLALKTTLSNICITTPTFY